MVQFAPSGAALERPSRRRASRDPPDEGCGDRRSAIELLPAQLAVHAAGEHLDRRPLLRVGKIETDNFSGLARRRVIELENRMSGRLEETVAGLEQLNRLAFQLKMKASGRHHPDGRDRMAMQSRRLPRREFDPRAPLIRRTVGFAAGSSSSSRASRLSGGKGVSAMAVCSF
jgi:hypothetical protein